MHWTRVIAFTDPFPCQAALQSTVAAEILPVGRGHFHVDATQIGMDKLRMQRFKVDLPQIDTIETSPDRKPIGFLLEESSSNLQHCGMKITRDDLVIYGNEVLHQRSEADFQYGTMSVPAKDFPVLCATIMGRELVSESLTSVVRPDPGLMSRLRGLHKAVGQLAHDTPDLLDQPEVRRALEASDRPGAGQPGARAPRLLPARAGCAGRRGNGGPGRGGAAPAEPPRAEHARALATHAQTLMYAGDEAAAARRAQQARLAARAADAPWVEADALVTLGLLAERQGEPDQALDLFTQAYREAQAHSMLGVELRAAFQVARSQLESGDGRGRRDRAPGPGLRGGGRARPGPVRGSICSTCTTWRTTPTAAGITPRSWPTGSVSG